MAVCVVARAQANEVLVTSTVRMLALGLGGSASLTVAGADSKGIPDQWQLFAVDHL